MPYAGQTNCGGLMPGRVAEGPQRCYLSHERRPAPHTPVHCSGHLTGDTSAVECPIETAVDMRQSEVLRKVTRGGPGTEWVTSAASGPATAAASAHTAAGATNPPSPQPSPRAQPTGQPTSPSHSFIHPAICSPGHSHTRTGDCVNQPRAIKYVV